MSGCGPGCPPASPGPAGPRGPAGSQGLPGPQGPAGDAITIQDEGILIGTTSILNFIGAGVTATLDVPNDRINVTIPGGGGDSCWVCDDPVGITQLATTSDDVAIGATAMIGTEKVRIVGNLLFDNANIIQFQSDPAGSIIGAVSVNATEQLLLGTGTLPSAQVHDVAAAGFYSWAVASAAVAGTGIFRVQHGWTQYARNSLNTVDIELWDFGATTANLLMIGNTADSITTIRYRANTTHEFYTGSAAVRVTIEASAIHFFDGTNANYSIRGNGEQMIGFNIAAAGIRNIAFFNNGSAGMNGMDGGFYFLDVIAQPAGNPAGGGYLYVVAGGGTWRGSGGTITTFGPA